MERNKEKIRLVVDTNILLSALLKDKTFTAKLLKSEFLDVYYPEDGLKELEYYKKHIYPKRKKILQRQSFEYALKFILESVHVIPAELYSNRMNYAYEVMKSIDEKDTPFLALALQLNCAVWSNDKHFKQQGVADAYTTEEVVGLLKAKSLFDFEQNEKY
ncbi:MAG: PIN domain-containing protein [Candidatus Methanoperedens sp.]|nr:PIN domain-containing protein [Candidatus Methanoperedens sp.]MCZ7369395.1 PIN domain-containing protein [Candidatus Methanoperedens sp.]